MFYHHIVNCEGESCGHKHSTLEDAEQCWDTITTNHGKWSDTHIQTVEVVNGAIRILPNNRTPDETEVKKAVKTR